MFSSSSSSSSSLSASSGPATLNAEWAFDPRPLCDAVDAALCPTAQKSLRPDLVKLVVDYLQMNEEERGSFFGEKEWEKFCGKVSPAPALPHNIEKIWLSQCPAFQGKRVCDSHMLVYLPTTVDDKPLNLENFGEIAKRYFPATRAGYDPNCLIDILSLKELPIQKSYWVLMTKDVLPGSRSNSFVVQQYMVGQLAKKTFWQKNFIRPIYKVPNILEATVCILTQSFSSPASSKKYLFSNNPMTFINCKTECSLPFITIGAFSATGIFIQYSQDHSTGVAALRKL